MRKYSTTINNGFRRSSNRDNLCTKTVSTENQCAFTNLFNFRFRGKEIVITFRCSLKIKQCGTVQSVCFPMEPSQQPVIIDYQHGTNDFSDTLEDSNKCNKYLFKTNGQDVNANPAGSIMSYALYANK